jgi:diguanylate cyclase (GGDEF)-like protein
VPRIVVEEGKRSWVQELVPDEPRITIGRALSNKVIIEDSAASREHCSVERKADGFHVTDLGSRNGTRVNGRAIKNVLLREGDRIEIGAATITFMGDASAKTKPASGRHAVERPLSSSSSDGAANGVAPPELLAQDPETGLASFAYFLFELRRRFPGEIDSASSTVPNLCVVKLDLDSLGLLNDVFGFRAGDEVIRTVGNETRAAVEEAFGAAALVAREAGGKFAVLLPGATGDKGLELAELVRKRVQARQLEGPLREAAITVSGGVAACPEDSGSWRGVLRRAEAALSEAKRLGRDRSLRPPPREPSGDTDGDISRDRTAAITRASGLWDSRVVLGTQEKEKLAPLLLTKEGQSALSLVAQVMGSDLELDGLLDFVLSVIADATGAKRGWLVLRDPGGEMRLAASVDKDRPGQPAPEGEMSQGIVRTVLSRPRTR